jgi:HupH hydrogenase expression protein, C-terminal conserved region
VSGLKDIAVTVIGAPAEVAASGRSGNGTAILHEISDLLGRLVSDGSQGVIDLRAMPLTPGDYAQLEEVLAAGAVRAAIDAAGPSEVFETAYPGVWWVRHRNESGETVAEFIEVTVCPEILKSHADDVREGRIRLRRTLDPAASDADAGHA